MTITKDKNKMKSSSLVDDGRLLGNLKFVHVIVFRILEHIFALWSRFLDLICTSMISSANI